MNKKGMAVIGGLILVAAFGFAQAKELSIYVFNNRDAASQMAQLYKDFTQETGIKVNLVYIPGSLDDYQKKLDISIAGGDTTDLFFATNDINYAKNVLNKNSQPIDQLAVAAKYDMKAKYGKYLSTINGSLYGVPFSPTYWAVFYNKKIFDDAKVPYPSGYWTWDDYAATAKKLTNPAKRIYGSYFALFDAYNYMIANQRGVSGYKADGTSNFDDPAFVESIKFIAKLGNELKVQPSYLEADSKKLDPAAFVTGTYGMTFVGTWMFNQLSDTVKNPRDWKWGITQVPVPDASSKINVGTTAYVMVSRNSKNPEAAFKLAAYIGENTYKYTSELPTLANFGKADYDKLFKQIADDSQGSITSTDIYKAIIDNGLGYRAEKITGSVPAQYKAIILKEAPLTYIGARSAEATCAEIKKQVDAVIKTQN